MDDAAQVSNKEPHFTLQWEGEQASVPVALSSLAADNYEDPDLCAWLNSAQVGAEYVNGGGASPACTVRRVS